MVALLDGMQVGGEHSGEFLDKMRSVACLFELLDGADDNVIADSFDIDFVAPFSGRRRWWRQLRDCIRFVFDRRRTHQTRLLRRSLILFTLGDGARRRRVALRALAFG